MDRDACVHKIADEGLDDISRCDITAVPCMDGRQTGPAVHIDEMMVSFVAEKVCRGILEDARQGRIEPQRLVMKAGQDLLLFA